MICNDKVCSAVDTYAEPHLMAELRDFEATYPEHAVVISAGRAPQLPKRAFPAAAPLPQAKFLDRYAVRTYHVS